MLKSALSKSLQITAIQSSDYTAWAKLFRAYIDFYKSEIPEAQYPETFGRLVDPKKDLYGLMLRNADDKSQLFGIAHFYPHQTPWSDKQIMHFNDLYIDPELRGQGYGRKMIEAVAQRAKDDGCLRLQWATQHGNPARKLYDQLAECNFVEYRMKF